MIPIQRLFQTFSSKRNKKIKFTIINRIKAQKDNKRVTFVVTPLPEIFIKIH